MMQRFRIAIGTACLCIILGGPANAQSPPPIDSVIAQVRARLSACDSQWTDMTYVLTSRERRLNSDGTVKKETTYRSRVYARHDIERDVLEAMWEDNEPVSEKTFRKELEKREKERRKQAEKDAESDGKKDRSLSMCEPFGEEYEGQYAFPEITLDTTNGMETWKITVEPLEEDEDLTRGHMWIETGTYRPVAEEYAPAKLPSKVKALDWQLAYDEIDAGCAMPRSFHIKGHGKALIFIKFYFEAEALFDSVVINPGLHDSLFAIPEE